MKFLFHLEVLLFILSVGYKKANGTFFGPVDLTIVPGSTGDDVVEACLNKLDYLDVFFNDFGLLRRIAKVESNFGIDYPSPTTITRGIWQTPTSAISLIVTNNSTTALLEPITQISNHYGDAFIDFNNFDLTIPFHSAIVARLYVSLLLNSTTVPESINAQSLWWSQSYIIGGDAAQFEAVITAYESNMECPSKPFDLWFLLDESTSVGEEHFQKALQFIIDLSRKFQISPGQTRLGFSLYSTTMRTISKLNEHQSNSEFEDIVAGTNYQRGRTYTGSAINAVIYNEFTESNGARSSIEGIPRVLILLTDGYSSDTITEPSTQAHSLGITIIAVGIGLGVRSDEIGTISRYPSTTFSYPVNNYTMLAEGMVERLSTQLCTVSALLPTSLYLPLTIPISPVKYFSINVPIAKSIDLEVSGISGTGIAYISTISNPSPSSHIMSILINTGDRMQLTVTTKTLTSRNAISGQLTISGFDPYLYYVPLFLSFIPQDQDSLVLNISAIVNEETTSTTTTTTSSTMSSQPIANALEWWSILLIVIAVLGGLIIFLFLGLFLLGLSRSSKWPRCGESCVSSFCLGVVKSPGY